MYEHKVTIYDSINFVGQNGVGKTSVIEKCFSGSFKKTVEFSNVKNYEKNFEIGQNKYLNLKLVEAVDVDSISENYCKNFILIYDITNRNSFEHLESYWIKSINENYTEYKSN